MFQAILGFVLGLFAREIWNRIKELIKEAIKKL